MIQTHECIQSKGCIWINTISFSRNINLKLKNKAMRKFLVTVAVALMTAMGVNAQNEELRHEVSVFYGGPSISHLGSAFGELVGLVFTNAEYDDGKIFGPIGGEYYYHCNNPRLAIGGIVTYSKWDSDVLRRNSSHDKIGERNRSYLSIMPSIKWYWVNKNHFGLYCKAAVGPILVSCTAKDYEVNSSNSESGIYPMFQASPIGVEFGGKFRGFAELGFGDQGLLLGGVRYKF
jgi:hypothetical protein